MRSQARAGFTLVELMVAMALTMFIMVILSQAFVIALDTFVGLKAIGDMQTNLRTAKTILTDDLSQDHFEGNIRLAGVVAHKPRSGFFSVLQASVVVNASAANPKAGFYVREGTDATGFDSFRASNHVLYMTVKRKGNRPENFFSASLPLPDAAPFFTRQSSYTMDPVIDLAPATYAHINLSGKFAQFNSQWAEVIYFMVQTGSTEEPLNPSSQIGMPLFSLMRAQFAMVTEGANLASLIPNGAELTTFKAVACNSNATTKFLDFYSPGHAAKGTGFRVVPLLSSLVGSSAGNIVIPQRVLNNATVVVPNATSFHIQIMPLGSPSFADVTGQIYDTSLATNTLALKGVQISLRVFDFKTRQTRQTTIVQDL